MDLTIHTTQNVSITCKPAGLLNRIAATLIDFLILGSIIFVTVMLFSEFKFSRMTRDIAAIIILLAVLLYHLIFELVLNGQSPGKMALKLRVVKADGRKLTFWDCMLRWVLRLVDITISMGTIAMLSIIVSSKMQRLGDLAAATMVVNENSSISLKHISPEEVPEDYQVIFPQATLLSDKDIAIIKEILGEVEKTEEYKLLSPLADKIKATTSIQTNMNNLQFIRTLLKDYLHLTR